LLITVQFFCVIFDHAQNTSRFFSLSYSLYSLNSSRRRASYSVWLASFHLESHIMFILFGLLLQKEYKFSQRSGLSITMKFAWFMSVFSINHSECAWLSGSFTGVHHIDS